MRLKIINRTSSHVYVNFFWSEAHNGTLCFTHDEWEEIKEFIKMCSFHLEDVSN